MLATLNAVSFITPPDYADIAGQLQTRGWCVIPAFLPLETAAELAREAEAAWQCGCFRHAGTGRGDNWKLKPEIRSDKVLWLDPAAATPAQAAYLDRLERLRREVNQQLLLGLFEFEGHFAIYPPGARYRKHLDHFRDDDSRKISCICYLNPAWESDWGGALRLYLEPDGEGAWMDIPPLGGQLVVFLSHLFYHEVLPATHHRYSLTGWFRQRVPSGTWP